jgi:dolichol-phosphate mannosyltransferase
VHNERDNIEPLINEITAALDPLGDYEILYVDDASSDDTLAVLRQCQRRVPRLRVLRHRNRCGQSTALHTGVSRARGEWIATLDGDGQNDPADIPKLIRHRDQHPEPAPALLAGWRKQRQDSLVRKLSSRIANGVRSRLLGDETPDTGCGLKLFRRDVFLQLPKFDHMHRFLPALVRRAGHGVESIEVSHRHRQRGKSKYGIHNRLWVGIVDLFGVAWLKRRATYPQIEEVSGP